MIPVQLEGLSLGSSPLAGDKWRCVVANVTRYAALQELLTFGFATTDTQELATAWFEGAAAGGLGFPAAQPIARGELFVVDMKFTDQSATLMPLSGIVNRWEQLTPHTQVVRVERIPAGESNDAATNGRVRALDKASEQVMAAKGSSPIEDLKSAGRTAVNTLQLLFWAVIVGGAAYIIARARR